MKKVLALMAFVVALSMNVSMAQTADTKSTSAPLSKEQTVSKDATDSHASCSAKKKSCDSKSMSSASTADAKSVSTKHEHNGKVCDPANCTEAQKKECSAAKAKGCCAGDAKAKKSDSPNP